MGEVPGDAGFLRTLIEDPPEVTLIDIEDLSFLIREVPQIVGYLSCHVLRDRNAPDRFLWRPLLEGPDLELVVAPVNVCIFVYDPK